MSENSLNALGRPANRAKNARIIVATEQALGHGGLAGTSVEAIARAAGVSKGTIYNQFGSFDALVMVVLQRAAETLNARVSAAVTDNGTVKERLFAACNALLSEVNQQHLLTLERVVQELAMRNRELAWDFYRKGPQTTIAILTKILNARFGMDAETMAKRLVALCRGDEQHLVSMSLRGPLSAEEQFKHISECIDFILAAAHSSAPGTNTALGPAG
jgi:TetR/AcrR family transcriptional regulator, mexJK operon transcriptional repressor